MAREPAPAAENPSTDKQKQSKEENKANAIRRIREQEGRVQLLWSRACSENLQNGATRTGRGANASFHRNGTLRSWTIFPALGAGAKHVLDTPRQDKAPTTPRGKPGAKREEQQSALKSGGKQSEACKGELAPQDSDDLTLRRAAIPAAFHSPRNALVVAQTPREKVPAGRLDAGMMTKFVLYQMPLAWAHLSRGLPSRTRRGM
jgi:hypothetical protein